MTETEALQIVKDAKTVAVYDMQNETQMDRPAYLIPAMLKERGLKLYPVNPKIESSLGEKALASLKDLPLAVDILDVFRRSDAIPELADEIIALPAEKRPKVVWLQTGIRSEEHTSELQSPIHL